MMMPGSPMGRVSAELAARVLSHRANAPQPVYGANGVAYYADGEESEAVRVARVLHADVDVARPAAAANVIIKVDLHPGSVHRGLREVQVHRALAACGAPELAVPALYWSGTDRAGRRYTCMDFVPGSTLADVVDRAGGDPATALAPFKGRIERMIRGMHACGYEHRDLHKNNVMVTPDGRLVLIDFGMSTRVRASQLALDVAHTDNYRKLVHKSSARGSSGGVRAARASPPPGDVRAQHAARKKRARRETTSSSPSPTLLGKKTTTLATALF